VNQLPAKVSVRDFGAVIDLAITTDELTPTDRTLFDIAARHVELTLKDLAIVARYFRRIPVTFFFAGGNTLDVLPREF
jgi:hypothetical protein